MTTTTTPIVVSTQFAYLVSVDAANRKIVADYADWFTGDNATTACLDDGLDQEYCEEFYTTLYYIRNTNPRQRTLRLAPDALIALGRDAPVSYDLYLECEDATPPLLEAAGLDWSRFSSIGGCVVTIDDLAESLEMVSYEFPVTGLKAWLTIDNGEVTAIQTQYVP